MKWSNELGLFDGVAGTLNAKKKRGDPRSSRRDTYKFSIIAIVVFTLCDIDIVLISRVNKTMNIRDTSAPIT